MQIPIRLCKANEAQVDYLPWPQPDVHKFEFQATILHVTPRSLYSWLRVFPRRAGPRVGVSVFNGTSVDRH